MSSVRVLPRFLRPKQNHTWRQIWRRLPRAKIAKERAAALVIRMARAPPFAVPSQVFEQVAHFDLSAILGRQPRQAAIRAAARTMYDRTGNLPPMPGWAIIIRNEKSNGRWRSRDAHS